MLLLVISDLLQSLLAALDVNEEDMFLDKFTRIPSDE